MRVAPINNSTPRTYSFTGELEDKIKNTIMCIANEETETKKSLMGKRWSDYDSKTEYIETGVRTVKDLQEYMSHFHEKTTLRLEQYKHNRCLEFYNSLLDVTLPIRAESIVRPPQGVQVTISEPYPYYLPEYSVYACNMLQRGLEIYGANIDDLLLDKAVENLKNGVYESPRLVYIPNWPHTTREEFIDKIMQYQEEIGSVRYSRKKLEKMPRNRIFRW